jgi:hypothetical protein
MFAEKMDLNLVHELLSSANKQPYGFLKVRGAELAREVEQMAAAGLVEASSPVYGFETYAVINRVTNAGDSFLRVFATPPLPRNQRTLSAAEH